MVHQQVMEMIVESKTSKVIETWGRLEVSDKIPGKVWNPKNPEVTIPVQTDVPMTDEQWKKSAFPYGPIPHNVSTHVNTGLWTEQIESMKLNPYLVRETELMEIVLDQLINGVNSEVGPPGDGTTKAPNFFPCPKIDIPRIADSLATEIKSGHMAGPLPINTVKDGKVNGFMAVEKADGSRRQVGNLSAPPKLSFNDGISPETLKQWRVVQTTAREFSDMLARCGQGAFMSCCDMVAAYKCLPVCLSQRRLQ